MVLAGFRRWATGVAGLVLAAVLAASCGTRTEVYDGSYPQYESLAALYSRADLVAGVRVDGAGRVQQVKVSTEPNESIVYTVFQATVTRVFKGAAKEGQSLSVKQVGGEYNGVRYVEEHTVYLAPVTEYVLFLEVYPDAPASLLNPHQAQYRLDASGKPSALDGNPIAFSFDDLVRLAGTR